LAVFWVWLVAASWSGAHVVTQLYAEWEQSESKPWKMAVQFEAGYADPAIRNDPMAPAPDRQWLIAQGEEGWKRLRIEAERYLRECLILRESGKEIPWKAEFLDFENSPPDFIKLLTDGAYLRMLVTPVNPPTGPVTLDWQAGENRPNFVLKMDGAEGGYLTLNPGASQTIGKDSGPASGLGWTSFRHGFEHVVPQGWDHVLFVMGLFFYRRKWRPLLAQSLAFTLAHTVTLGLASAGIVKVSGGWVEPLIALSLVAVALENFRAERETNSHLRLAIVFGFGLVHGLGFAGALSAWLKPGEGFLPSLLCANLGVEAAQAALLATAWVLTISWHRTKGYRVARAIACLAIAVTGTYWAMERVGWLG
jgi:hypothetical protein